MTSSSSEEDYKKPPRRISSGSITAIVALALPALAYYLLYTARLGEAARYHISDTVITLTLSEGFVYLVPAASMFILFAILLSYALLIVSSFDGKLPLLGIYVLLGACIAFTIAIVSLLYPFLDPFIILLANISLCLAKLGGETNSSQAPIWLFGITLLITLALVVGAGYLASKQPRNKEFKKGKVTVPKLVVIALSMLIRVFVTAISFLMTIISLASVGVITENRGIFSIYMLMIVSALFIIAAAYLCKRPNEYLAKISKMLTEMTPSTTAFALVISLVMIFFAAVIMQDQGKRPVEFGNQTYLMVVEADDRLTGAPVPVRDTWCVLVTFDGDRAVIRPAEKSPNQNADHQYKVSLSDEYRIVSLKNENYDLFDATVEFIE